jgi:hypothetical protein
MNNPVLVITDKVMRMIKSMVYLAMRVNYRKGATTQDISGFLSEWAPSGQNMYHEGVVERVLDELRHDGLVARAGACWYAV